ncbi:MAG: diguanylate cyclase [Chitinispirillaceae bacterium]|nr:diguanylate cyclase [Chitinispirillaceae bacterium]
MPSFIKLPSECRILIVDDEITVGELLKRAIENRYQVHTCLTGSEACSLLEQTDFDVVVSDLRLPDISGIDVLNFAKSKDPYTEVLLITGYASLESAAVAINLGAISYIEKPLSIADFQVQVEKAIASRLFHLKSISLMHRSDDLAPEFKDHLHDITALYYFTRKLTLSLETSEVMRITLDEALRRTGTVLCAIGVEVRGFREIYAMVASGEVPKEQVTALFLSCFKDAFPFLDRERFEEGSIPLVVYKGKQGVPPDISSVGPAVIPMMVTGTAIGSLTLFLDKNQKLESSAQHFLYIISSIVSSLIEHGYTVLQARQLAKTDGLTGIANHRSFQEALDREIARAQRKASLFSLLIFDIDDFKQINDRYGHLVGDAVLKNLVARVSENIRTVDVFARYGGEEFGLILPETDRIGAEVLAGRIREAVTKEPFTYLQHTIFYTISMGITVYKADQPVKKDLLIDQADTAMYASKRAGKNRVSTSAACV